MAWRDMRDFLARLESDGELQQIDVPVSAELEIAAITERVCRSPGLNRTLLFTRVSGFRHALLTNLFGSEERLAIALGRGSLAPLTPWFDEVLAGLPGESSLARLASLVDTPLWRGAAPLVDGELPPSLEEAPVDLELLPFLKNQPGDGFPDHAGRFITLPLVITPHPDGGAVNCGMYRCAVTARDRLAIQWSATSGGAAHAAAWEKRGEPMPLTIVLGGPPALTFSATLPLPEMMDEFSFAGLLAAEPLRLCRCGNGLPAPEGAELVIEGVLHPGATNGAGAFANHTGYYTPAAAAAAVQVTAIRHRPDLIMPATVVGRPPMEDCWLARGWERLLLSLLKIDLPEVTGLHLPFAGIFHGGAIIALRAAAGRGGDLLQRLRSLPWLARSRALLLVDDEQDPADEAGVCWRVMNNCDWSRDVAVQGETLTIDATRKPREKRLPVIADGDVAALVERRWREYGFETD